jgi:hypothetical protein
MQESNKKWVQFSCYAAALGTSLVLQVVHPDLFAILCTPLPIDGIIKPSERLDVPLNSPILNGERIK